MGIWIIGISLVVSFAITFASVGVWFLSVPLAALIGSPYSPEALGCAKYIFLGIFIGTYILSFCWQVYQALNSTEAK